MKRKKLYCTWSHRGQLPTPMKSGFGDLDAFVREVTTGASKTLTIVSPFLSAPGMVALRGSIAVSAQRGATIKLICAGLDDAESNSRKGIRALIAGTDGALIAQRLRVLTAITAWTDLLHAKCIVADSQVGYLGSANLSLGGMDKNFELGIPLDPEQASMLDHLFSYLEAQGVIYELTNLVAR